MWLLAVEYLILIIDSYPTATTWISYKSTDGIARRPSDKLPNSDRLENFHQIVPELTVQVYQQPRPPISHEFGSDPDSNLKWQSTAVVNLSLESNWLMFAVQTWITGMLPVPVANTTYKRNIGYK
jgi:hypothetical protein